MRAVRSPSSRGEAVRGAGLPHRVGQLMLLHVHLRPAGQPPVQRVRQCNAVRTPPQRAGVCGVSGGRGGIPYVGTRAGTTGQRAATTQPSIRCRSPFCSTSAPSQPSRRHRCNAAAPQPPPTQPQHPAPSPPCPVRAASPGQATPRCTQQHPAHTPAWQHPPRCTHHRHLLPAQHSHSTALRHLRRAHINTAHHPQHSPVRQYPPQRAVWEQHLLCAAAVVRLRLPVGKVEDLGAVAVGRVPGAHLRRCRVRNGRVVCHAARGRRGRQQGRGGGATCIRPPQRGSGSGVCGRRRSTGAMGGEGLMGGMLR